MPIWMILQHAPAMVFVACVGAAVGSFLNVVVYRLPSGMGLMSPPSRCPICGRRLSFFRENLPILGWLLIRGRCRTCGTRVSPRYMFVEIAFSALFLVLYAVLYLAPEFRGTVDWVREIGGPWWSSGNHGFFRTWPAFFTIAVMLSGLYAMTHIDARTFTIPIEIPRFVTGTAFVLLPLQALLLTDPRTTMDWPFHGASWPLAGAALGGMAGVLLAWGLLVAGVLRYSFEDYDDYVAEGEVLGDYPHARREMGRELLFLLPVLIGAGLGWLVTRQLESAPPAFVQALGGIATGYLAGGGIVWAIRILGTLGFGREAMGMGDVHLLAAVGAVLGWPETVLAFFIAPFFGILAHVAGAGLAGRLKERWQHLPYGPHLALASLIVLFGRPGFDRLLESLWGFGLPARGLFAP
jgi:leader peptidase (prepilin peptidase)/N-methyltransferase